MSDDNFRESGRRKFMFAHAVHVHEVRLKFVYDGHRIKVKITPMDVENSIIPQCKTSIGNNSGSIKHRTVKFACSMGFTNMAGRMV